MPTTRKMATMCISHAKRDLIPLSPAAVSASIFLRTCGKPAASSDLPISGIGDYPATRIDASNTPMIPDRKLIFHDPDASPSITFLRSTQATFESMSIIGGV